MSSTKSSTQDTLPLGEVIEKYLHRPADAHTLFDIEQEVSELIGRGRGYRIVTRINPSNNHVADVFIGKFGDSMPSWAYEKLAPRIREVITRVTGRNFEVRVRTSDGMNYIVFHGKNSRYSHGVAQSFRDRLGSIFTEQHAMTEQFKYHVDDSIRQRSQLR